MITMGRHTFGIGGAAAASALAIRPSASDDVARTSVMVWRLRSSLADLPLGRNSGDLQYVRIASWKSRGQRDDGGGAVLGPNQGFGLPQQVDLATRFGG